MKSFFAFLLALLVFHMLIAGGWPLIGILAACVALLFIAFWIYWFSVEILPAFRQAQKQR